MFLRQTANIGSDRCAGPKCFLLRRVSLALSLQEVAAVDGLYRIRVPRVSLQADRQAERQVEGYLTAFVRAVRPSYSALSAESGFKRAGNRRLGRNTLIQYA